MNRISDESLKMVGRHEGKFNALIIFLNATLNEGFYRVKVDSGCIYIFWCYVCEVREAIAILKVTEPQ